MNAPVFGTLTGDVVLSEDTGPFTLTGSIAFTDDRPTVPFPDTNFQAILPVAPVGTTLAC